MQIAKGAAGDLARLASLRRTLREKMRGSPLMDARRFAEDMESVFRKMWRGWCDA
jgi:predicted O-linked N-acetylglucosamine transferase (SPINDLY family)